MSDTTFGTLLGLFGMALPLTMFAVVIGVQAVGRLKYPADQPPEFRLISRVAAHMGFLPSRLATAQTPDTMSLFLAGMILVATVGSQPVIALQKWQEGATMIALGTVVVFEILWLRRIRQAIIRSHRSETGSPPSAVD